MLNDYEQELTTAAGQAITATAAGTKPYDGKGLFDPGVGNDVHCLYKVANSASDADFNNCTSLDIAIQACDDAAGTNAVTLVTKNVLLANLTKAKGVQRIGVISPGIARKRFLRAYVTLNGTAPTTGKLVIWLVAGPGAVDGTPANQTFTI